MLERGWIALICALGLVAGGCYESLGDLCHPSDPECNDVCGTRECGPAPDAPDIDCGQCSGAQEVCNAQGRCEDDCDGRECGQSPSGAFDCGDCDPGVTCNADGQCSGECFELCPDQQCRAEAGCCDAADCGPGAWTCNQDKQCNCEGGPCGDNSCPAPGACCGGVEDDARCGATSICEGGACIQGPAGALHIDGNYCSLDGDPCPPEYISRFGLIYTLLDPELVFTDVTIRGGALLTASAVDDNGLGGRLVVNATGKVLLAADGRISMSSMGWGGGGGGGGLQYCDMALGPECQFGYGGSTGSGYLAGESGADGEQTHCVSAGHQWDLVGAGSGGKGGGYGGEPGHNGGDCASCSAQEQALFGDGGGGRGGGPFGGAGGLGGGVGNTCFDLDPCCNDLPDQPGCGLATDHAWTRPQPASVGLPGGYAAFGVNGDVSIDDSVLVGSGGGGGAGGRDSTGDCCGAADGGAGGVLGGRGHHGCTGGGGGGGGAAGGGAVEIRARDVDLAGPIEANGAGEAALGGGFGAGGGILVLARQRFTNSGVEFSTLGGASSGAGLPLNGGTVKVFYREITGPEPEGLRTGRLLVHDMDQ